MTGSTFARYQEIAWRRGHATPTSRLIAEEIAIALSYNGSTHAVMMATPADLEDFGIGFTLTEGIVARAGEIGSIEVIPGESASRCECGSTATAQGRWLRGGGP
ncbi:hypothetical protein BRAS3843_530040 [Bradyrhizobium sp. STM 3843]|nr:hypothetical protein BRAS3843_530040 [Bradyrhizobium sp. STM 3843]